MEDQTSSILAVEEETTEVLIVEEIVRLELLIESFIVMDDDLSSISLLFIFCLDSQSSHQDSKDRKPVDSIIFFLMSRLIISFSSDRTASITSVTRSDSRSSNVRARWT